MTYEGSNYNHANSTPDIASDCTLGQAVKSELFVGKLSDRRLFSREFRPLTNQTYHQALFKVDRLKQQIYKQYTSRMSPSTFCALHNQNCMYQHKSTSKVVNFMDAGEVDRLKKDSFAKPVSILKQSKFKSSMADKVYPNSNNNNHNHNHNNRTQTAGNYCKYERY